MIDIIPQATPLKSRFRLKNIVLTAVIILLASVLIVLGSTSFSIYYKPLPFPWVQPLAQSLPFPAFVIDGQFVSYSAYLSERRTVKKILEEKAQEEQDIQPSNSQIMERIVGRYVRARAIERIALQKKISLEAKDV